jgi:hypothetical protein
VHTSAETDTRAHSDDAIEHARLLRAGGASLGVIAAKTKIPRRRCTNTGPQPAEHRS